MLRIIQTLLLLLLLSVMAVSQALRANQLPVQPARPAPGLRQMISSSGYIFAGTVVGVQRIAPANSREVGAMQITFRVTQGIQGVRSGQTLTIREWIGLWDSSERYRVGERVALFLHRPSKLGLTSPVGGALGRFSLDDQGHVVLDEARSALFAGPAAKPDVRGTIRFSPTNFARTIRRALEE